MQLSNTLVLLSAITSIYYIQNTIMPWPWKQNEYPVAEDAERGKLTQDNEQNDSLKTDFKSVEERATTLCHLIYERRKLDSELEKIQNLENIKKESPIELIENILCESINYNNLVTTTLNLLLEKGDTDICKVLLPKIEKKKLNDLFGENKSKIMPLFYAFNSDSSADIMNYLLTDLKVFPMTEDSKIETKYLDDYDKDGNTLLHYACSYGETEFVKWLVIDNKANHKIRNIKGELPLHWAAAASRPSDNFEVIYNLYAEEDYLKEEIRKLEREGLAPEVRKDMEQNRKLKWEELAPQVRKDMEQNIKLKWEKLTPEVRKDMEKKRYKKFGEDCLKIRTKNLGVPVLFAAKALNFKLIRTIFDHQIEADGTLKDEDCDTVLHFVSKKINIEQLSENLKANALLGTKNKVGIVPLDWLNPKTMKDLLDKLLTSKELEEQKSCVSKKDHNVIFIDNKFGHHASGSDVKNILALANSTNHQSLALHPVCQSILSAKWQKMRKYFLLKLLFFIPFVILLSAYPVLLKDKENSSRNATEIENDIWVTWYSLYTLLIIQVVFGSLSVIVLIKPFLSETKSILTQWNKQRLRLLFQYYYTELMWSDWYEYMLWILAFLLLHSNNSPIPVSIVSWFSLFLVCSKHPAILPYRFILVHILFAYIKLLAFAFGLISGFAMGFYLLLRDCKQQDGSPCVAGAFQNIYSTALKIPSMMMGEINFESFQLEQPSVYFLFASFIFLITCCFFNMMNGLAINITQDLMQKSELFKVIAQAEMIYEFEVLLKEVSSWMTKFGFKKLHILSPLWIEMLKVSPSSGMCKNLEEYDEKIHGQPQPFYNDGDMWENYAGGNKWVWVDRGYSLNMKIIYEANKIIDSKVNKIIDRSEMLNKGTQTTQELISPTNQLYQDVNHSKELILLQ